MARSSRRQPARVLEGAEEFAGPDVEEGAKAKMAEAAEAAKDDAKGHNGGPIMDLDAWRRACIEYSAEMLEIEDIESKKAEIAGRISSIRKVAKKLGVDWDLVRRYYEEHKRIRKGGMGAMVAEERRYRQLLKMMESPLGTQFSLWEIEAEEEPSGSPARPGMDAELQGQHAYSNNEPRENNPFQPGTQEHVDWGAGWNAAQTATAMKMAPA